MAPEQGVMSHIQKYKTAPCSIGKWPIFRTKSLVLAQISTRHIRILAVCCSVLQYAVVHCSVSQRVAVCCRTLKSLPLVLDRISFVTRCCSVLQRVVACRSVLQRVAACCSVLQRVAAYQDSCPQYLIQLHVIVNHMTFVAACCSMLQRVAVFCSVLVQLQLIMKHTKENKYK